MYKKMILITIYLYQFLMSAVVTIVFLVIPLTKESLDYIFVGLGFFIWLFFIYIYFFVARTVKKMIDNKYLFYSSYYRDLRKDLLSFLTFLFTFIICVLFIYFFMEWAFSTYLPDISSEYISVISGFNGLILGTINFIQYFFLLEE